MIVLECSQPVLPPRRRNPSVTDRSRDQAFTVPFVRLRPQVETSLRPSLKLLKRSPIKPDYVVGGRRGSSHCFWLTRLFALTTFLRL
jgi:hypothetical protein